MSVAAHQPPAQVVELCQLHLQLAFLRLRAFGENRQNQPYAVEYAALQNALQIAFLRRRQLVVEHHQFDIVLPHAFGQLFGFARADKQRGMGFVALGGFGMHQIPACGANQVCGFGQGRLKSLFAPFVGTGIIRTQHHARQHHAFGLFQGFVDLEQGRFGTQDFSLKIG